MTWTACPGGAGCDNLFSASGFFFCRLGEVPSMITTGTCGALKPALYTITDQAIGAGPVKTGARLSLPVKRAADC